MTIPAIERALTRGKLLSDQSTSRMIGGIYIDCKKLEMP